MSNEKNAAEEINLLDLLQSIAKFLINILLKVRRDWIHYARILLIAFGVGSTLYLLRNLWTNNLYSTTALVYSRYLRGKIFLETVEQFNQIFKEKNFNYLKQILGNQYDEYLLQSILYVKVDTSYKPSAVDYNYFRYEDGYFKIECILRDSISVDKLKDIQHLLFQYFQSIETIQKLYHRDSISQSLCRERYLAEIRSIEQLRTTLNTSLEKGTFYQSFATKEGIYFNLLPTTELHREIIDLYNKYVELDNYLNAISPLNYLQTFSTATKLQIRSPLYQWILGNEWINLLLKSILAGFLFALGIYTIILLLTFNRWLSQQEKSLE
ncbi:MAG: hypothetical protein NZM38_01100 [Cytophagales bacterium]|nr:hypothetical protein [Cytophagales bacterium]MDW8383346.1 hypothetical protein [Flammeovirgaceae bacterium]